MLRKNGLFWGYVLLFGWSDGAPHGPRVLLGGHGEGWGWGGWVVGLTLDFRPTVPIVTHDLGRLGRMDCFGSMYRCLGGLMGSPVVPEC